MWSHVTSIFGRLGRTALATEPCVSTDFSTVTSAVPAVTSPTYSPTSPSDSDAPRCLSPNAPALDPLPPNVNWLSTIQMLQRSGPPYDPLVWRLNIVGYHHPPRWLELFVDKWLPDFTPRIEPLDLPHHPKAQGWGSFSYPKSTFLITIHVF